MPDGRSPRTLFGVAVKGVWKMFAQRADHFAGFAVGEPADAGRIMDAAAVVKVDGSVRADLDAQGNRVL